MGDYKKQDIVVEGISQGILSDISKIKGIGRVGTYELYSRNIRTVQELKNAIENSNIHTCEEAQKFSRFKGRLERFLKYLPFDWNLLQNIPQYVLELEGNYK
jgi:replicative superfamily II helicase